MSSTNASATAARQRPRQHRWPRLVPLVAALVLAGCSLAPKYERPEFPVAADWPIPPSGAGIITASEAAGSPSVQGAVPAAAGVGWRHFYRDPDLQRLIELALENNRDLRIAVLNIEAARAQYFVQRSELAPSVGVGAAGQRQRVPGDMNASGSAVISSTYQVGISMPTFEIDLFGRIRSLSEAALAQYLATEEARRNVQITLVAQVAEAWFNLYATAALVRLTEQTLESRRASYELVKARYDAGVGSALDLNQAETLLDTSRSDLLSLQRQGLRARNAITQIVGTTAPEVPDNQAMLRAAPLLAEIPAGMPSSVLLARPDVLAAEQQLISANANIGAARAAFFPNISLTALFGTASAQLSNLFSGGSLQWSFAPQIALPIFSGGALRGQLELAEVRRDIAVASYERTIQQAFREVSDGLAGTATYEKQIVAQADLVAAAQRSLDLAQLRYDSGVDSYLQLHDAERTLYGSQQGLVLTRLEELLNRVALYKALGGGWMGDTDGQAPAVEDAAPGGNIATDAQQRSAAPAGGAPASLDTRSTAPAGTPSASLPTLATTPARSAAPASGETPASPARGTAPVAPAATIAPAATPAATATPPAQAGGNSNADILTLERTTWRDTVRGNGAQAR